MSRKDRKAKGRSDNLPPFKPMFNFVWKSPAFQALTPTEVRAYLEFKFRYKGDNNGMIAISNQEIAVALGVTKMTASRAVRRLIELGFIVAETPSGFSRKNRTATEYRLTEHPNDLPGRSREPTREFMKWRPEEKTTVTSESATVTPTLLSGSKAVQKPPHSNTHVTVSGQSGHPTVTSEDPLIDIPHGGRAAGGSR